MGKPPAGDKGAWLWSWGRVQDTDSKLEAEFGFFSPRMGLQHTQHSLVAPPPKEARNLLAVPGVGADLMGCS